MTRIAQQGKFKFALAVDSETTGLFTNSATPDHDPSTGAYYQAVSWGLVVVDVDTFQEVESLYVEIEHDGKSIWDTCAEQVHGLSKEYLASHGMSEEEAVVEIASLLLKYWGPDSHISLIGHNVATFDLHFLRSLFRRHDLEVLFSQRTIDTAGLMMATFGAFTSDEAFEIVGVNRELHNALEDARASLTCLQTVNTLWKGLVNPALE